MSQRVRQIIVALSLLGVGIAGYLSWTKFSDTDVFCGGLGSCSSVQHSAYAYLMGIPVAYLGLLAYLAILAVAIFNLRATPEQQSWSDLLLFGLAVGGFAFSVYLTYTEIFILNEICPWCVASFLNLIIITVLAAPAAFGASPELEAET